MYNATEERVQTARDFLREALPLWLRLAIEPIALEAAICVLIESQGGVQWLCAHPGVLREPVPVLHGAGFRPDEMNEYSQTYAFSYGGDTLFITPDIAATLVA